MNNKSFFGSVVCLYLLLLGLVPSASAANYTWSGNTSANWATGTNWSGSTAPVNDGSADVVLTGTGSFRPTNQNVANPVSILSLTFASNATTAFTLAGSPIRIGTGGLTVQSGSAGHTISQRVYFNGDQNWTNNSINTLTASGRMDYVNANDTITFAGSGNFAISGQFVRETDTAGLRLVKTGTGTLTLSNTNNRFGANSIIRIDQGAISISSANNIGNNEFITFNGGTLQANGTFTLAGNVRLQFSGNYSTNKTGSVEVTSGNTFTLGSANDLWADVGGGILSKTGPGTMVISGANGSFDQVGGNVFRMTAGRLDLRNAGALGNVSANSTLELNGGETLISGSATLTMTTQMQLSGTATLTSNRTSAGAGFTHSFAGNVVLGGNTLTVQPGTNVTSGTAGITWGNTTLTGSPTLNVVNSASAAALLTVGAIGDGAGTYGLTKTGNGTLVVNAAGTFDGPTAVQNGTLRITGGADRLPIATVLTLGNGTTGGIFDLNGNNQTLAGLSSSGSGTNRVINPSATAATLTVNQTSGSLTYDGVLGNTGQDNFSVLKTGPGTWELTAANTFSGLFSVSAGKAAINNTTGTGTGRGNVNVAVGATLAGNGFLAPDLGNSVTVNGFLSPGNSIGVLTVGSLGTPSQFVLNGTYLAELNTPSLSDRLTVYGDLTLDAGSILDIIYPSVPVHNEHYVIASYSGSLTGTFGTINLLPGWQINYGTGSNSDITLLSTAPEPGTLILLVLGSLAVRRPKKSRR